MKLDSCNRLLAIVCICFISFTLTNCKSTFQKIGKNIGNGVVKGVKEKDAVVDSMVTGIVSNLRKNALGDSTMQKVDSLLNAVTLKLKNSADSLTNSVRDSLLSEYTALKIKKIVLEAGDGLGTTADELREKLLGSRTKFLIEQMRNDLLGDSTVLAVAKLRNELLGEQTKALVDSLLQSSITTISKGFKDQISPQIKETLKDAEDSVESTVKYIAWILGVLAVVLSLVAAFFWRKFSRRKKIMRILTQEINQIDSQEQYDNLVAKIKERTTKENLETSFQQILKEEQLLKQEEWVDKDKQLLKELTENLHSKLKEEDVESLHKTLEDKGLKDHFQSVQNR